MVHLMEQIWNAIISIVMCALPVVPTEGLHLSQSFEPGSMEITFPEFTFTNLGEMASKIKRKSQELTLKTVRDSLLMSCADFNNPYFFMALQAIILMYYPSVAISIIYQYYDIEMQQDEEQEDILWQPYESTYQSTQSFNKQQYSQSLVQEKQMQFVQLLQKLISQLIQSQSTPQPQQQQWEQFVMQQQQSRLMKQLQGIKSIKATKPTQNNENEGVKVKVMIRLIEEERHVYDGQEDGTKTVWKEFIITF